MSGLIIGNVALFVVTIVVLYLAYEDRKQMAIRFDALLNRQMPGAAPVIRPKDYKPPEPEVDESHLVGQVVAESQNGAG